jgi:hypothetical protein
MLLYNHRYVYNMLNYGHPRSANLINDEYASWGGGGGGGEHQICLPSVK